MHAPTPLAASVRRTPPSPPRKAAARTTDVGAATRVAVGVVQLVGDGKPRRDACTVAARSAAVAAAAGGERKRRGRDGGAAVDEELDRVGDALAVGGRREGEGGGARVAEERRAGGGGVEARRDGRRHALGAWALG